MQSIYDRTFEVHPHSFVFAQIPWFQHGNVGSTQESVYDLDDLVCERLFGVRGYGFFDAEPFDTASRK
jgi:hypothetical protein